MKLFLRILKYIGIILLCTILIIFVIRWINGRNTKKVSNFTPNAYLKQTYGDIDRKNPEKTKIPGIKIELTKGDYYSGYHLVPDKIKHKGVIITFGGSEGSSNFDKASLLAKNGYEVYSIYFFGQPNQQKELISVPIDFFEKLVSDIHQKNGSKQPITVLGGSKGAELALLLASKFPNQIDHVVLYAPSSYVFQGLTYSDRTPHSSWSYQGKDLPFLSFYNTKKSTYFKFLGSMILNKPTTYGPLYQSTIENAPNLEKAAINLKTIRANLLIFTGEDDKMWPSAEMARKIQKEIPDQVTLKIYPNTGHLFLGPPVIENIAMGGDLKHNEQALEDSDKILLEKLNEWTR